jgi:hypothetical protein
LRDDDRQAVPLHRRFAVAAFRRDVDLHRQPREALDPVFADETRHIGGSAADNGNAPERLRVDRPGEGFEPHRGHVDIVGERMADDFRLLVDLLGHKVPVIAFLGEQTSSPAALDAAVDRLARRVADVSAFATDDDPVAFLEIGDAVGERGERQRIRAEIHCAVAIADRERRALPCVAQRVWQSARCLRPSPLSWR